MSEMSEMTHAPNLSESAYCNPDLAPTLPSERKWGLVDILALWVALSACIPTYMLGSSLIDEGMDWQQAVVTIFVANIILLLPLLLNAHAGTKYGIPFPVYCRASFGILGANIPAVLRGLVACGWFGIQTWIGGDALYKILTVYVPGLKDWPVHSDFEINLPQFLCFIGFWSLNMLVIYKGIDSIRLLLKIKAPLLIGLGVALLAWAYSEAGGFGPILSQPSQFDVCGPKEGQFWSFFFPALTANVGFWATLSLNIPDFSRYARSQGDQAIGQVIGLPLTMGMFAFIGVAVTSATIVIYEKPLWNPTELLAKFENPIVHVVGLFCLCLATLATNIAANVVSPANDFANLWPRRISFRIGGLITGIVGIFMQPWRLVADPTGYIFTWLIAYSALLGGIGGILIADYYLIRRMRLDLAGLYHQEGPYWYLGGFNPCAILALIAGVAPCLPGFLVTIGVVALDDFWKELYHYAWFLSFGIAFGVYTTSMKMHAEG